MAQNPFWQFSCGFYARPGVAETCLKLQDEFGFDVNLLLLCLWFGHHYGEMETALLQEAIALSAGWQKEVVAPLRAVRRRMKANRGQVADQLREPHEQLREQVKRSELVAEQLQQQMLYALVISTHGVSEIQRSNTQCIIANLEALRESTDIKTDDELTQAFHDLAKQATS